MEESNTLQSRQMIKTHATKTTLLVVGALATLSLMFAAEVLCALPAFAISCPNEESRTELGLRFLPDCRSYEMISPVYKEGYPLELQSYASNGEKAYLYSFADLAGLEGEANAVEAGNYVATRNTNGGWQISPVNPSAAQYPNQFLVRGEANNGLSLWIMHTPQQSATAADLYVRSAAGDYRDVGPLVSPEFSQGEPSNVGTTVKTDVPQASTSNYEHIVINSKDAEGRWPFDHTLGGGGSLLEYSGTGNSKPTLVAAFGEKGSTELTGTSPSGNPVGFECGASLGSISSYSTFNAISSDGETIFFTPNLKGELGCPSSAVSPEVSEVWARVHGGMVSPSQAATVDVSARSETECTGVCQTSAESGKNFEGASENGEKVFFTSTQQLLNGAHQDPLARDNAAGRGCARTKGEGGCNLYEYDFAALPGHNLKLIAGNAEVLGVMRIAPDGSRIYFVARGVLTSEADRVGQVPQPGKPNLYVYNTNAEQLEPHGFVSALSEEDERDWAMTNNHPAEVSPADGRYLLFASSTQGLTPDDHSSGEQQLFLYDSQSAELIRVSKAENEDEGSADDGNAASSLLSEGDYAYLNGDFKTTEDRSNISVDNGVVTVAFESAGSLTPLAPAAQDGCFSVYEYRSEGPIGDGSVHLISNGNDVEPYKGFRCGAQLLAMDESASNILFESADSLLPSDTDGGQVNIFDARVDGGVPKAQSGTQCSEEDCALSSFSMPEFSAPASTTQEPEDLNSLTESKETKQSSKKTKKKSKPSKSHSRHCTKHRPGGHGNLPCTSSRVRETAQRTIVDGMRRRSVNGASRAAKHIRGR
ncbi:MAG TPA: hypothetical protein VNV42_01635 [Solirubrobacteraceae bacterium]|jgi:hypothetical protein|nr:hypothetical protein [Solirubrobacteraceae bacterium]